MTINPDGRRYSEGDYALRPFGLSRCASQAKPAAAIASVPKFSRAWAMPDRDTFAVSPIRQFIKPYLRRRWASVDPFARNSELAHVTNDLNPDCPTHFHMDAEDFCKEMARQERKFDLAFFDPPYSPRQISECYNGIGRKVATKDTQNASLYKRVRDALLPILTPDAIVLSFGWNSAGMGAARGFELIEIALVAHGGAHNDTICIAERRVASCDTHPKDGDAQQAPLVSGAVPKGQTPKVQRHD